MNSLRRTTWGIFAALAVVAWAPSHATAKSSPLLSGYGGPGQGEQAILGAGLLNTPKGGGGSGGSGSSELALPASAGATRGAGHGAGSGRHRGAKSHRSSGTASAPARSAPARALAAAPVADRVGSGGALGVSSSDLLYILLALAALALTGVVTRQLARRPH
jgi:hypothetical protein